jgi:hypothetical protein
MFKLSKRIYIWPYKKELYFPVGIICFLSLQKSKKNGATHTQNQVKMEPLFVAAVHEEKTHQDLLDLVSNSSKSLITHAALKKLFPELAKKGFKKTPANNSNNNVGLEFHAWIASQCSPFLEQASSVDTGANSKPEERIVLEGQSVITKKRIPLGPPSTTTQPLVLESVQLDDITTTLAANKEADSLAIVHRLSSLYSAFVVNQYVPTQMAVLFLSKLSTLPWIGPVPLSTLHRTPPKSNTVIKDVRSVAEFTVKCITQLLQLIVKLGPHICSGFASSPVLKILSPNVAAALNTAAIENESQHSGVLNHDEYIAVAFSGSLIRPFREDIDSRLEYSSEVRFVYCFGVLPASNSV